jgi:histidinol phosphate phosphatase hisN-like protein
MTPYVSTAHARVPTRDELIRHLVGQRIAGRVATTRQNNLGNFRRLADRDPGYLFGIEPEGSWTFGEVLALMAERCGVSPDEAYREGVDYIDPELTVLRLEAMAARLRQAAQLREPVIVATGHPTGLLAVHLEVARALAVAGCPLLMPAAGWSYEIQRYGFRQRREIRYVGGVAMLAGRGELQHTHSPRPMVAMLDELRVSADPGAWPGLVVADHGWAGAAGQAGIDSVGFADSNDPALFVAEAEGKVLVTVPLDDNVAPHLYAPMTAYLLSAAGL